MLGSFGSLVSCSFSDENFFQLEFIEEKKQGSFVEIGFCLIVSNVHYSIYGRLLSTWFVIIGVNLNPRAHSYFHNLVFFSEQRGSHH